MLHTLHPAGVIQIQLMDVLGLVLHDIRKNYDLVTLSLIQSDVASTLTDFHVCNGLKSVKFIDSLLIGNHTHYFSHFKTY